MSHIETVRAFLAAGNARDLDRVPSSFTEEAGRVRRGPSECVTTPS